MHSMSNDPLIDRRILAVALEALDDVTNRRADTALRAEVQRFLSDVEGTPDAAVRELAATPVGRWFGGVEPLPEAERRLLWRWLLSALWREPISEPGGWDEHTAVIDLARLALAASVPFQPQGGDDGPGAAFVDFPEPASPADAGPAAAGAEPPAEEPAAAGAEPPEAPEAPEPPAASPATRPPDAADPFVPPVPRPSTRLPPSPTIDFRLPPRGSTRHEAATFSRPPVPSPSPTPAPAAAPATAPRWIQGQAWRPDAPQAPSDALEPLCWNLLAVHVGPSERPRRGKPVPESGLDFSQGEVALSLQLELAGARIVALDTVGAAVWPAALRHDAAEVKRWLSGPLAQLPLQPLDTAPAADAATVVELAAAPLSLPRQGDSSAALFAVCPLPGVSSLSGRIALLHRSRVLQTARVAVAVSADTRPGEATQIQAEESIHPDDPELNRRRAYDVAIQVSDVGGSLHLVVQQDGQALSVQLSELAEPIDRMCSALAVLAGEWDYSRPWLEQEAFSNALFTLANRGVEIADHLRETCGDAIDHWQRIHLVPMTSRFFPLDYAYDGPPPKPGKSRPCPNLQAAMRSGGCDRALQVEGEPAACPHRQDAQVVCPMHFWGFHRVIERSGTVRPAAEIVGGPRPAPGPVVVPGRQPWGRVDAAVLGATDRAFFYLQDSGERAAARAALVADLGRLFTVHEARDWEDWRLKVRAHPKLLMLLVHTDEVMGARVLEIGHEDLLTAAEIRPDVSGGAGQPQLLLLIGCSAADVQTSFQPYPERFRKAGVSIVLAPIAPVRGEEAVRIARLIAQRIVEQTAAPQPVSFGELLPRLRRELLGLGHPAVLGLVGFGDGDWQIGGA